MSLVTRGLGAAGILVTAGLGLTLGIIVVPPDPTPVSWESTGAGGYLRKTHSVKLAATITIPAVEGRGLLADIEAKGSASTSLFIPDQASKVGSFKPAGAAKASVIGVKSDTKLGQILASGEHDLEDEELLSMLLALLNS